MNEDDINKALNTPTENLGQENEPEEFEQEYDPDDNDPGEDPNENENEPVEDPDDEPVDMLDALLGNEKPSTRKEGRVQRLANERREADERAERAEREAQELRDRLAQQETDAMQRARLAREQELAEMDPTERRLLQAENEARQARFEAQDGRDRAAFDSLVARNPHLGKLAQDVEKELSLARRNGQYPTREAVAKFILGNRAFEQLQNAPKLKKAAKQRVDNARGRPMGAQSDARSQSNSSKGETSDARERRLMGVRL